MKTYLLLLISLLFFPSLYSQGKKWELVWSDEFNYSGLPDSSKWIFETEGNVDGWGNHEKQFYTNRDSSNAYVSNGTLKITAKKNESENHQYTSARLSTSGKKYFQFGKIEVRAKLPKGSGTWPAVWMLGNNINSTPWPSCGEIDIMEHVGYEKDSIYGTIHSEAFNHVKGTQQGKAEFVKEPYTDFNTYAIQWTEDEIEFLLNDKVYFVFKNVHKTNKEWPFNEPFFIIMNLAIGGDWGGKKGVDNSIFPATMEVDYIRVYQRK